MNIKAYRRDMRVDIYFFEGFTLVSRYFLSICRLDPYPYPLISHKSIFPVTHNTLNRTEYFYLRTRLQPTYHLILFCYKFQEPAILDYILIAPYVSTNTHLEPRLFLCYIIPLCFPFSLKSCIEIFHYTGLIKRAEGL